MYIADWPWLTVAVDASQQNSFEEVFVALHGAYGVPVRVEVWTVLERARGVGRHRLLWVVGEELEHDMQVRVVRVACSVRRRGG